jgi:hypothetical protein
VDPLRKISASSRSLGSSPRLGTPSSTSKGLGVKVDSSRIPASRTGQLGKSAEEGPRPKLATPAPAALDERSASLAQKPIRTSRCGEDRLCVQVLECKTRWPRDTPYCHVLCQVG